MEIYENIRYYREHTDYSQRNVAKILGVSRNTVKKYWEGQTVPWERKPGSGRKNDIITDEVKSFIIMCLESDKKAPRKQHHTAHKIYERLVAECGFEVLGKYAEDSFEPPAEDQQRIVYAARCIRSGQKY